MFVLYINDLVEMLNKGNNICLAFADDLVVYAPTHFDLQRSIQELELWSQKSGIEINP